MATKIRLSRIGTKKKPFFRVVVMDEGAPRNSRTIEVIGVYDPRKEPVLFEINKEKMQDWLSKGATPTEIVRKMLGKIGMLPPVSFAHRTKRLSKDEEKAKKDAEAAEKLKKAEEKKAKKEADAKAQAEAAKQKEEAKEGSSEETKTA